MKQTCTQAFSLWILIGLALNTAASQEVESKKGKKDKATAPTPLENISWLVGKWRLPKPVSKNDLPLAGYIGFNKATLNCVRSKDGMSCTISFDMEGEAGALGGDSTPFRRTGRLRLTIVDTPPVYVDGKWIVKSVLVDEKWVKQEVFVEKKWKANNQNHLGQQLKRKSLWLLGGVQVSRIDSAKMPSELIREFSTDFSNLKGSF